MGSMLENIAEEGLALLLPMIRGRWRGANGEEYGLGITGIQMLGLPLTSCVTLRRSIHLSGNNLLHGLLHKDEMWAFVVC